MRRVGLHSSNPSQRKLSSKWKGRSRLDYHRTARVCHVSVLLTKKQCGLNSLAVASGSRTTYPSILATCRFSIRQQLFQTSKAILGEMFLRTAESDSAHLFSVLRTTVLSYCRNAKENEMYNTHQKNHFDCRL